MNTLLKLNETGSVTASRQAKINYIITLVESLAAQSSESLAPADDLCGATTTARWPRESRSPIRSCMASSHGSGSALRKVARVLTIRQRVRT